MSVDPKSGMDQTTVEALQYTYLEDAQGNIISLDPRSKDPDADKETGPDEVVGTADGSAYDPNWIP